jgi:hypothetical protein
VPRPICICHNYNFMVNEVLKYQNISISLQKKTASKSITHVFISLLAQNFIYRSLSSLIIFHVLQNPPESYGLLLF